MKTPEELNALKAEVEAVKEKLADLTEEELKQVPGGADNSGEIRFRKCCRTAAFRAWTGVGEGPKRSLAHRLIR